MPMPQRTWLQERGRGRIITTTPRRLCCFACATMLWPRRDRHDGFAADRGSKTVKPQLVCHYACAFGDATDHSFGWSESIHLSWCRIQTL